MMLPQQWEGVAAERQRDWQKEIEYRQVLAQLPTTPPRWRRWAGSVMVSLGSWLLHFGERMIRHECPEHVPNHLPNRVQAAS